MTGDQQPFDSSKKPTRQLDVDFALQAAGLGVWEVDSSTNQLIWDDRCCQLFGLASSDSLPYEKAIQYIHPDDRDQVRQTVETALNAGSDGVYDQTFRTLSADDGQWRWVRFQGRSHFNSAGELFRFAGIAQEVNADVTQQILTQKETEISEQLLRDIVLWAPIGIGIVNAADLVIESVNEMFIEIAGKPYEQLVGHNYWVPFAEAAPYYAGALNRVAQEGETFSIKEVELMLIRHGKEDNIYVTFVYMPLKGTAGQIKKVVVWVFENTYQVAQRKIVEGQVAERTQELAAANEELATSNEELTAGNEEYAAINEEYVAVNEELEEANELLHRSNKNLQEFAYIASHDLQEPLRKIQQFGDLLHSQYGTQVGEGLPYLERMQGAASRMSRLIKDLLSYSRLGMEPSAFEAVSLSRVVDTVLGDLELRIEETRAQVQMGDLPTVSGDASQLGQLFLNLVGNALKFRQPGTAQPLIQIRSAPVAATDLPAGVKAGRGVEAYHRIEVIDNGIGFEAKYADQIFQVFQRLHGKNQYAGTGIGLAVCQKVVTNHGGAITASSAPGQGATFSVYLPQ